MSARRCGETMCPHLTFRQSVDVISWHFEMHFSLIVDSLALFKAGTPFSGLDGRSFRPTFNQVARHISQFREFPIGFGPEYPHVVSMCCR